MFYSSLDVLRPGSVTIIQSSGGAQQEKSRPICSLVLALISNGEVVEWLKAAAGNGRYTVKSRIGGSNPSLSAKCPGSRWRTS